MKTNTPRPASTQLNRLILSALLLAAANASGSFHTWDVSEIYRNADGSVQFVELHEASGFAGQNFLTGHTLVFSSPLGTNTFSFPTNLPASPSTAGRFLVIGTANLASQPGGVPPNYVFANFLLGTSGTLNFGEGFDVISFTNLPTDGSGALFRSGASMVASATNSPVNFSGTAGSIVPAKFSSVAQSGANIAMTFATASGPNYAVERNGQLGSTNWTTATNVTGNGAVKTVTLPLAPLTNRFFRLRVP